MTTLAGVHVDPIFFFGSGPGFVYQTQSDPGFVNPVRSDPVRLILVLLTPIFRNNFVKILKFIKKKKLELIVKEEFRVLFNFLFLLLFVCLFFF